MLNIILERVHVLSSPTKPLFFPKREIKEIMKAELAPRRSRARATSRFDVVIVVAVGVTVILI